MNKRLGLLIGAGLLLALLVLALRPRPERVETATVTSGPLRSTIDAEGVARVEERYVVGAPVSGLVQRIDYEVGDRVRAGDVVAVLEAAPAPPLDSRRRAELAARVEAAAAAVRRAEAQAEAAHTRADLAATTLARMRPLAADSILAPAELDRYATEARQAESDHSSAEAAVEAARQELRAARALLGIGGTQDEAAVPVRAPADGIVLAVHHESEGVVAAGQPLLELGDPDALDILADVLSDEALRIVPDMRVEIDAGTAAFEGRVRRVEPVAFTDVSALGVEEQRVWVHVGLADVAAWWEAPLRIGHGYRVRVRFVEWEAGDVLRVPGSALFEHEGGWAAFVLADRRVRMQVLSVGRRTGLWAEILGGLAEGDEVITHPGDDLADGLRVVSH